MKKLLVSLLVFIASSAVADERILHFHSEIKIKPTGWIEVTETIVVRAEGAQIRRGIFRDYLRRYKDRFGNDFKVIYEPRALLRNDRREDFFTEKRGDYLRAYFGSADRMIESGIHTYVFTYDAGRALGFFESHDELYWNVTGHLTEFPTDNATATVSFDFSVNSDDVGAEAYTGGFGSAGDDYQAGIDGSGRAQFEVTAPLGPREGLTIVVTWPKGLVHEPGILEITGQLLLDNLNLLVAVAGLLGMLAYYIPTWKKFGKDPEPGVIFTRYEPPGNYSPASLRYIENMSYDDTAMTAAVVSLAVKGYLRIIEDDDEHSLMRLDPGGNPATLAAGERELLDALFADGELVVLDNENHELLGGARGAHKESLKRDYASRYFKANTLMNLPPLIIGVSAAIIALNVGSGPTFMVFAAIVAMLIVLVTFAIIMKKPTALGRKLLDEVSGFREYLEIAEKDEMNLRNPPEKTPLLFESYLPFALAMGVEQQWGERFAEVFARLAGPENDGYQPAWYSGHWNNHDMSFNTTGLSTGLGDAVSHSVMAPGSSSGAGGGGFSGGGGGGGGTGGW